MAGGGSERTGGDERVMCEGKREGEGEGQGSVGGERVGEREGEREGERSGLSCCEGGEEQNVVKAGGVR